MMDPQWSSPRGELSQEQRAHLYNNFGVVLTSEGEFSQIRCDESAPEIQFMVIVADNGEILSRIKVPAWIVISKLRELADSFELEAMGSGGELPHRKWDKPEEEDNR